MTSDGTEAARAPRIAVIVPCFNDGELVVDAVRSLHEDEPVEVVVIDDGSEDPATLAALEQLESWGVRVIRHERNRGLSPARMTGLEATSAPFVFPLDADDLAIPGALAALADRLESEPNAVACFGDYAEFGDRQLIRAVPDLDPYRLTYTNEYPATALYRRTALEAVGGWRATGTYEDWDVWMTIAERGMPAIHFGHEGVTHLHRIHAGRLGAAFRARQWRSYGILRDRHRELFASTRENRRGSPMPRLRKLIYPVVYGRRPRLPGEARLKTLLDRLGVWTLTRPTTPVRYAQLTRGALAEQAVAQLSGDGGWSRGARGERRVAVVITCDGDEIDESFARQAIESVDEREPVEIVVVERSGAGGSVADLEATGARVVRPPDNGFAALAHGLGATQAPFVFPLAATDRALPGVLGAMADLLDARGWLAACYGDRAEFGEVDALRAPPPRLDAYRLLHWNEYPRSALFRREAVDRAGGWQRLLPGADSGSEWSLWLRLAARGAETAYLGRGIATYAHRVRGRDVTPAGGPRETVHAALRQKHADLFARAGSYRRSSTLSVPRQLTYPIERRARER